MSAGLNIGQAAGGKFLLPREVATQATAVLGIRGSGKTVTATVLVEELLDEHQQVVVIDPTDVWWGLKSSFDGESEGYPIVVLGGPHGDLPLQEENARALADFAVEQRVPMVLSLRHLRKNAQRRFVTDFCEQLYHRKGELAHRTPLLVAMDEASAFVPQKVGGAEARMVGAVEDLVRRGRSAGIGVALIDQRPASLNKDVLTQVEVLVSHQITSPQDRKALDEWVRQHDTEGHRAEFLEGLSSLPRGTAWFWSPGLDVFERVSVRMRKTYDSSKTPKPGENPEPPAAWAEVDLEALRAALTPADEDEPEPGEGDKEVSALRRRVAELERQLAGSLAEAERADARARAEAETEARLVDYEEAAREARKYLLAASSSLESAFGASSRPEPSESRSEAETVYEIEAQPPQPVPTIPTSGTRAGAPRARMLATLADLAALGLRSVPRPTLAVLSSQGPKSSAFREHLAAMRKEGLVESAGGEVTLTDEGLKEAPDTRRPMTLEELHRRWVAHLPPAGGRILFVLAERYPDGIERDDLANATGQSPKSSAFREHLAELGRLGIARSSLGRVRATELLFPAGIQ